MRTCRAVSPPSISSAGTTHIHTSSRYHPICRRPGRSYRQWKRRARRGTDSAHRSRRVGTHRYRQRCQRDLLTVASDLVRRYVDFYVGDGQHLGGFVELFGHDRHLRLGKLCHTKCFDQALHPASGYSRTRCSTMRSAGAFRRGTSVSRRHSITPAPPVGRADPGGTRSHRRFVRADPPRRVCVCGVIRSGVSDGFRGGDIPHLPQGGRHRRCPLHVGRQLAAATAFAAATSHTYLKAAGTADARYTLGVNWRQRRTKPMNDNAFCTQRTATLCERIDL